ncbi:MAG: 4-(cytidine 5'-diphospho)-2-C-methyl-D-erythritol kinase [Hyphomicrobiales bacterium]|nr:4-(cytidine 5'-diphospho)-2-C-methyl-D-erythritol kinase [Hyphomicrobiales bacterium]
MTSVELFAPAKVNLYLHITGRREDGYHLLDSLVVFAGTGDNLRFAPAEGLTLALEGPGAWLLKQDEDNLVLRAARLLAEALGRPAQAAITLEKNLPVASGIGGGSADAAATLRGLLSLWEAELDEAKLKEIGLKLGADLPVCLVGRPTQMSGIGEILTPSIELPPAWLVLVNPRLALSTPAVFKARTGDFTPAAPLTGPIPDAQSLAEALHDRRNDLAHAAVLLEPVVAEMLAAIAETEGCLLSRMSGSGATCFGLYADEETADNAADELREVHSGWWISPAPILG